jgi:hypothetical protein
MIDADDQRVSHRSDITGPDALVRSAAGVHCRSEPTTRQ